MIRIVAINDCESSNEDEDEGQVSKEAEETIAISEYIRALKFEKDNKTEDAKSLFKGLLETQVLSEISKGYTNKTLFSVKYNCFKNLGFIYDRTGNKQAALENLLSALELDDTDVFTMSKLGQIALGEKHYDIAHHAFEKCLKENPNYWPAGDGILQILCARENYTEAYGWALLWYDKNPEYHRGLQVILDIREKFRNGGLDCIENSWMIKFKDTWNTRIKDICIFPKPSFTDDKMCTRSTADITKFQISSVSVVSSWLSLGKLIVDMYTYFIDIDDPYSIAHEFTINDLLIKKLKDAAPEKMEVSNENELNSNDDANDGTSDLNDQRSDIEDVKQDEKENSNSNTDSGKFVIPPDVLSADASAEDSDANRDGNLEAPSKPKQSRRRGSGLQFLEQWCFWDRNRKYSQRRKNQQNDRPEIDTTLKGSLRKILPKYYEESFDNELPFNPGQMKSEQSEQKTNSTDNPRSSETLKTSASLEEFQSATDIEFDTLFQKIKASGFCLLTLIREWPQLLSKFWQKGMPLELQDLYLKIFGFYITHYDFSNWHQLDELDFQAAFRMAMFYLELSLDRAISKSKPDFKNEMDHIWLMVYNHMIFHSGFFEHSDDEVETSKYQKRLCWLQYCLAKYENDLPLTLNCLNSIKQLLSMHNESYRLDFPNQQFNILIDMDSVKRLIKSLERTISLNDVPRLYEMKSFEQLIITLQINLGNLNEYKDVEVSKIKIATQIEVFLESLWCVEMFEDCLVWSERCLAYTLDRFLESRKDSPQQIEWATVISYILTYIEQIIINETYLIVSCLGKYYSRLIQNIVKIVSHQLDAPLDRNSNNLHKIDTKTPWVILHYILQREEDKTPKQKRKLSIESNATDGTYEEIEETVPNSIMVFFTAHEYLGHRCWCTKDNGKLLLFALDVVITCYRTPYLEAFRDILSEHLEQITYCLYGYPAKRARLKHIEEHDAQNIELTWDKAVQLFDLFRPDELPEFNSFKNDSITSEMEQLLQRIVALVPAEIDPDMKSNEMNNFIAGQISDLPCGLDTLPYRVQNIYYLLADHYFKNRDLSKSVKYFILDLTNCPQRFDSWAGLALSKASLLETKLNTCDEIGTKEFLPLAEEVLRCFQQCLKLDSQIILLWIEYGNYAYALHSYCSRNLKQFSDTLSMERFAFMEEKKEECLKIAHDCFMTVDQEKNFLGASGDGDAVKKFDDAHDEKWLYHYMLGKISEKRKEQLTVVLEYYIQSAKFLYESNATYPFRISFTTPQNLSLEALEIFYRITASIIKYVEQHRIIPRCIGKYFLKILKESMSSPFALSQAKINESSINAFKRKISMANEEAAKAKMARLDEAQATDSPAATGSDTTEVKPMGSTVQVRTSINHASIMVVDDNAPGTVMKPLNGSPYIKEIISSSVSKDEVTVNAPEIVEEKPTSPTRRGSQESTATNTTQTTTTTGSDTTTSSSSESSSSDSSSSETDDSSSEDGDKDENSPLSDNDIEQIYKMCIKNLEECVTRFPEHYKSMYRLVHIYLHAPEKIRDIKKCKQLLLGTYTTALGNQIQGLFADRKGTNLFNGIWRNPSTEIDRPGSFSAHLSKCVNILMEILRINMDHGMLLELIFQLQKTPEIDKRYIKDTERKDLLQQALAFCSQAFKDILRQHTTDKRNDMEIKELMLEIYKAHKKCVKNITQKEAVFSALLVEAYKLYIQGKVNQLPENTNIMDLALKFCVHEINSRNRLEKQGNKPQRLDDSSGNMSSFNNSKNVSTFSNTGLNTSIELLGSSTIMSNSDSVKAAIMTTTTAPIATPITTPITTITTVSTASTTSTTLTASTTSTATITSTYIPGLSRPRGRPPGSKNSNSSNSATSSGISSVNQNTAKNAMNAMGANSVSAMMALYANPSAFLASLTQFTDPANLNAFLAEYYKLTNLSGLSLSQMMSQIAPQKSKSTKSQMPKANTSKQQQTHPSPSFTSSTPTSALNQAKLPQLDIQALFSSAQTTTPTITTTTKTTLPFKNSKPSATTVISVGSGELTITPSMPIAAISKNSSYSQLPGNSLLKNMQNQSTSIQPKAPKRSLEKKGSKKQQQYLPVPSSHLFADMPGISVTTVPKPSNIPMELPKSLSITPAPASQSPKSTLTNYSKKSTPTTKPFVTMQTGKLPKQQKQKKKSDQWNSSGTIKQRNDSSASGLDPAALNIPDFNQQLALFNQYNELFQNQSTNKSYMSQFEQFLTYPVPAGTTVAQKSKSKPVKGAPTLQTGLSVGTAPSTTTGPAHNLANKSSQPRKGSISVKQLQTLQQPQKPTTKSTSKRSSIEARYSNPISGTMLNPFALNLPTPLHSSSPQKSQLASISMVPSSAALVSNHTSPTKTLQQKLAERQKALNDANQQASANNSRPSSTSSAGSKSRKSDLDVIVLD